MKVNEYIRICDPNRAELAKLLKKAKGDGRSMRQFAAECGANQSTFSRIANQVFIGASSDKLIRAIAEHADPESGVTLDALMAANGMAKVVDSATVCRISEMEIEKRFNYVIIHELDKLGDFAEQVDMMGFRVGTTFKYRPDIVIKSSLIDSSSDLWAFDLFLQHSPSGGAENNRIDTTRVSGRRILDKMGRILPMFYCDEQDGRQVGKYSLVVTDQECFSYIKAEFANYHVPFEMSFILFDIEKDVIEDEFILKQPDGYVSKSVFDEKYDPDG